MVIPMAMVDFAFQFVGFSVKFDPLHNGRVLVATAGANNNRGAAGNGCLLILAFDLDARTITQSHSAITQSGLSDIASSNLYCDLAVSAVASGSVTRWNTLTLSADPNSFHREHSDIVRSVDWSPFYSHEILTASSDDTINLWIAGLPNNFHTFPHDRQGEFSSTAWSPRYPCLFASASGSDGTCRLCDTRQSRSIRNIFHHLGRDVLWCDWNKVNPDVLATTAGDDHVRVWDIRYANEPVAEFEIHHSYWWNKVRFSPHRERHLISCSNIKVSLRDYQRHQLLGTSNHHGLSILRVDMSPHINGLAASTGEDGCVCIWLREHLFKTPILLTVLCVFLIFSLEIHRNLEGILRSCIGY